MHQNNSGERLMSRNENILLAAFVVALAATLGALYIGEILGQTPCILCWYQRIAMFPLVVVLGIAAFRGDETARFYVLPLAAIGLILAAWHSGLYFGIIPEPIVPCTKTGPSCTSAAMTFVGVPIPLMSLFSFAAITIMMTLFETGANK